MKKFLKTAFIVFLCGSLFFGGAYFYLYKSLENAQKPAGKTEENIPYYELPENCGLRFCLPGRKDMLIFLDFTEKIAYIITINKNISLKDGYAGYSADYDLTLDYPSLSELFDRLGGLDLESEGELLRFTGVQVCDGLCTDPSGEFRREVARAVCVKIGQNGFSSDDFAFLLSCSGTGLKMPVCIYWQPYLKEMFANAVFVN